MQCLILILAFAHFPFLEVHLHNYTGVGLFGDGGDFCFRSCFLCRWRPHRYPKVENKIEAAMATLIDDAIAIVPS